jgi:organic hydroperoxide reductase OsmC/OhrA
MASSIRAVAVSRGGYAADVAMRQHGIRIDEPPHDGGGDSGPMPTELLCAALAACFLLALQFVAGKRALELPGLEVVATAERAGRELRYGRFIVDAQCSRPRAEWEHLIERAAQVCWVSNTISGGAEVVYRVTKFNARFPE